jgi:ABC-type dipeptide/oligopeptide/nickel transport system permease component
MASLDDTLDDMRRRQLLQQIQRRLAADAVNGFLFQYPRLNVWNAHWQGLDMDNVLGVVELRGAHFERSGGAAAPHSADATPGALSATVNGRWPVGRWAAAVLSAAAVMLCVGVGRRFGVAFVIGRLTVLAATLLMATAIVFVVVQVAPGDPARYMMGLTADPDTLAALRHQLGLDVAPVHRYFHWIGGLLHGDFGLSYTYRVPVGALVTERLQVSAPLACYALLLSTLIAFPVGLVTAARRGRPADRVLTGLTQLGLAIPNFWMGMLLVMLFAVSLHWVSAGGFPGWGRGIWPGLKALTLPAIALAMPQAAILARVLRGALIDTLHEDYIRTARAKGAGEWQVLWRHALPNAMVPVLTILGMQFSFLLAGGVIIENVFFLPGLGRLVFQAIVQRDLMVVQSVVVLLVLAVVSVTFVVDLGYTLINPRLRTAGG